MLPMLTFHQSVLQIMATSKSIWLHLSYDLVSSKSEYCQKCTLVVLLCSILQLRNHLSSWQVWSTRFCLMSLGSFTVLIFLLCGYLPGGHLLTWTNGRRAYSCFVLCKPKTGMGKMWLCGNAGVQMLHWPFAITQTVPQTWYIFS